MIQKTSPTSIKSSLPLPLSPVMTGTCQHVVGSRTNTCRTPISHSHPRIQVYSRLHLVSLLILSVIIVSANWFFMRWSLLYFSLLYLNVQTLQNLTSVLLFNLSDCKTKIGMDIESCAGFDRWLL